MFKEFREFINRGNVVDLAVGGRSFAGQFIALNGQTYATLDEAKAAGAAVLAWGSFVQSIIDFLIIAFVVFLMVRAINRMKKAEPPPPPGPTKDQELLTEIRDLLRQQKP